MARAISDDATDNDPGQRAFYVALGSTDGSDFKPEPLRMFALFR